MIPLLFIIAACIAFGQVPASSTDQQLVIQVGSNVLVSRARPRVEHGEVVIAAAVGSADHLIAASMVIDEGANTLGTVVYTSRDGGESWKPTLETDEFALSGDPALAFGPEGEAYYVIMASETPQGVLGFLQMYRSEDAGLTWISAARLPNGVFDYLDREWVTVDTTDGIGRGTVFVHALGMTRDMKGTDVLGSFNLYRSRDGARSFYGPVKRVSLGKRYPFAPGNAVVLSDGTLACVFPECKEVSGRGGPLDIPPSTGGTPNAVLDLITSSDQGDSLDEAITVADHFLDWNGPAGTTSTIPSIAVDPGSDPFGDRLYVVWPDRRSGRLEILFSFSSDHGGSWSMPKVINDDSAFDVRNPGAGPDDFMPVVAVNRTGMIGVMWYDRRGHPDNLGYTARFAASLDGGETFSPSVVVSEASYQRGDGDHWAVWAREGTTPSGLHLARCMLSMFFYTGGHTAGMTVDVRGDFHPIWIDNRTGIAQAWTSRIHVEGDVVPHGSPELAALTDLGTRVTLAYSKVRFDRSDNTLSMDARLENTSRQIIRAPVKVRVVDLRSAFGRAEVVDSDNEATGSGAVWDFSSCLTESKLRPGDSSGTRRLVFRLAHLQELRPRDMLTGGLVEFRARVLGSLDDAP